MVELVGVLGAGTIGRGVAQALAQAGLTVVLVDVSTEILERATAQITADLRMQRLFKRDGVPPVDAREVLGRIRSTTEYAALTDADLVIENVPERWTLKASVYPELDAVCQPNAIFAANTSAIPIARLAALTHRPTQVLGMHFMNPVPLKQTVEVVRGELTSDQTLDAAMQLLKRLGKAAIVVADSPGFVINRVLMLAINEAIYLLEEDVAQAAEIDSLFKNCLGHAMGPLETADLIGLDTVLYSIEVLHDSFKNDKYRPSELLRRLVEAGQHGHKSGSGFYQYPHGAPAGKP